MSPVLRALASPKGLKGKPKGLKGKNPRLQHQSEKNWVAQKLTKGGGGGLKAAAAPLCRFFCSQNSSNCCWRSWIFSFQSLPGLARACQGSQNWAHWGLSKKEYKIPFVRRIICVVSENVNIRFRLYLALRAVKIEKTGPAKPSMSLFFIACYPILIPDSEST